MDPKISLSNFEPHTASEDVERSRRRTLERRYSVPSAMKLSFDSSNVYSSPIKANPISYGDESSSCANKKKLLSSIRSLWARSKSLTGSHLARYGHYDDHYQDAYGTTDDERSHFCDKHEVSSDAFSTDGSEFESEFSEMGTEYESLAAELPTLKARSVTFSDTVQVKSIEEISSQSMLLQHPPTVNVSASTTSCSFQESEDRYIVETDIVDSLIRHEKMPHPHNDTEPSDASSSSPAATIFLPIHFDGHERSVSLYAVFDGHNGPASAEYLQFHTSEVCYNSAVHESASNRHAGSIPSWLEATLYLAVSTLEDGFMKWASWTGNTSGACLAIVLVCDGYLTVANLGDCQCALLRGPPLRYGVQPSSPYTVDPVQVEILTEVHRSVQPAEQARILSAGGVTRNGLVMGCMEPSRAVGDMDVKRVAPGAISAIPRVVTVEMEDVLRRGEDAANNRFGNNYVILLATDGLWDFLPYPALRKDLGAFVRRQQKNAVATNSCSNNSSSGCPTVAEDQELGANDENGKVDSTATASPAAAAKGGGITRQGSFSFSQLRRPSFTSKQVRREKCFDKVAKRLIKKARRSSIGRGDDDTTAIAVWLH